MAKLITLTDPPTSLNEGRRSCYIESASLVEVMFDQLAWLLEHVSVSCSPECPHCARLEKVKNLLLAPFQFPTESLAVSDPLLHEALRAGLLLESLKGVIQLDAARWTAFQDHVPAIVIYAIAVVGLLAIMIVCYTFGLSGLRQPFSTCLMALAITLVLAIIVDVDRPREGLICVSQQPVLDLQQQLRSR